MKARHVIVMGFCAAVLTAASNAHATAVLVNNFSEVWAHADPVSSPHTPVPANAGPTIATATVGTQGSGDYAEASAEMALAMTPGVGGFSDLDSPATMSTVSEGPITYAEASASVSFAIAESHDYTLDLSVEGTETGYIWTDVLLYHVPTSALIFQEVWGGPGTVAHSGTLAPDTYGLSLITLLEDDTGNGTRSAERSFSFNLTPTQAVPVIPEPLTALGLAAAVCGLGGYLRRRRQA